ncbi:hypothetical protein DERP_009247 [Dermatophagoides pteronyssinus]|uniref:Uncharacterized protein n=1 Tax=Dermatophagoides pteronyssinus TaxID=6956 RepID=A0ABQ8JRJ0_DERPT|nr:hypothetical protein DERP_009247 [Dermatophagoides pteronyssinus]
MKSIHILSTILLVIILINSIQSARIKTRSISFPIDYNKLTDQFFEGCIRNRNTSDDYYRKFCKKLFENYPLTEYSDST